MKFNVLCKTGLLMLVLLGWEMGNLQAWEETVTNVQEEKLLIEVLDEISREHHVYFTYDSDIIKGITVDYEKREGETVRSILTRVLSEVNMDFKIFEDRFVILYRKDEAGLKSLEQMIHHMEEIVKDRKELFANRRVPPVAQLSSDKWSEIKRKQLVLNVTGRVMDANGEPLIGVNVQVRGTNKGTATDFDGRFSLNDVDDQAVLVVSYIGYRSQEVPVNGQTSLTIVMQEDAQTLDEVVVVGYGTLKKNDLTGSVKSINLENIPSSSAGNLTQVLRGQAPGLSIQGGNSTAGDQGNLQIRGQNTLSAGTSPLIVVDGIIFQGSISDINVDDVQRVDVLRDASAAAVYGSKSANGVIIVTTKTGKEGEPTIGFNTSAGFQDYTHLVPYMNGQQYAERLVNYAYTSELYSWYDTKPSGPNENGGRPEYPDISNPDIITGYLKSQEEADSYRAGKEINWMDQITRKGNLQNYNLNVSGGTSDVRYYMSGSHVKEEGVLVNDAYSKNTLRAKIDADIIDWLTVGINTAFSSRDYSGEAVTLGSAQRTSPLVNLYNENGGYPLDYNNEFLMAHPFRQTLIDNQDLRKYFSIKPYAKLDFPFLEGLSYEFNYSYNTNIRDNNSSIPTSVYESSVNKGVVTLSNEREVNWLYNNILKYNQEFGVHRFDVTMLYSREHRNGNNFNVYVNSFQNQSLGYNAAAFGEFSTAASGAFKENSIAYMARLNYALKDKYLLTGTIRQDGYSGFGSDNKYATFKSMSLAWIASEENFLQSPDWLSQLKLRISYGENGNQGIGRYVSLSKMKTLGYVYGGSKIVGIVPNELGNNELGWEKTSSLNLGLDFGMINYRITGSIDIYTAKTTDVLVNRSLPGATGYSDIWTNIGAIDNKGIDIGLNTVNVEGPFSWESGFVFSLNRDKISKLYGDGQDDIGNSWFIGQPISAIYDYERTGGVWTEDDLYNGNILENFYPGQFKLKDFNNDGKISPNDDRTIVGYAKPNYQFSLSNNLKYKNLSLYILINSIQSGNGYYIQNNQAFLEANPNYDYANRENQPAVVEFWTPFNGVTNATSVYNYPPVRSGNFQNRSFVRLQSVTLSYKFDRELLQPIKLKGLELYINGENLLTWTNWDGYDPELGDRNALLMRNIVGGLKIKL